MFRKGLVLTLPFGKASPEAVLRLFRECPNMRAKSGDSGTDKFLPNPNMVAPLHISMYEFVGKLIGLSMRIGGNFPFDLPALVYKALCGEQPSRQDLLETDEKTFRFLSKLEKCDDEDEFKNLWRGLRYVMTSANYAGEATDVVAAWSVDGRSDAVVGAAAAAAAEGRGGGESKSPGRQRKNSGAAASSAAAAAAAAAAVANAASSALVVTRLTAEQRRVGIVELFPGGASCPVSFADKQHYVDLAFAFRLREFDTQLLAIRRGFNTVVPERALRLFTATEVDELVSGSPLIDLDLLKAHTRYSGGYREGDAAIKYFWRAMESFTNEERIKFIKFAWGRSRLPRQWEGSSLVITRGSASLPIAHTCFFQVELPAYRTYDVMRQRLLVAIVYGLGSMDGID